LYSFWLSKTEGLSGEKLAGTPQYGRGDAVRDPLGIIGRRLEIESDRFSNDAPV
jgi:hypothetical protein